MIASVSFVLTGNLICNFPQTGEISNFPLLTCMNKHQIPKRIRNNANHISSSIMVLQTNTMTLGKLVIKLSPQASGGFVKVPRANALGTSTNPPSAFGDI